MNNSNYSNANEWKCNKCGEILEIQFTSCWNCGKGNNLQEEDEIKHKEEVTKPYKEKKKINWKNGWDDFKIDESFLKKTPIKNKYTVAILYYIVSFFICSIAMPIVQVIGDGLFTVTGSEKVVTGWIVGAGLPLFVWYFISIYRFIYFMIKRTKSFFQKRKKKKSQKIIIKNETATADITDATETIKKEKFNEPVMTSDEALTELKKSKEKLDLELITQEEYNKVKEELKQYIS